MYVHIFICFDKQESDLNLINFLQEINSIFGALAAILNLGDIIFCSEEANFGVFIENLVCLDKGK